MKKQNNKSENFSRIPERRDINLFDTDMYHYVQGDNTGIEGFGSGFMSQKRAADFLGISQPTLRKYTRLGFLTRFTVGRRKFYRVADLELAKAYIF